VGRCRLYADRAATLAGGLRRAIHILRRWSWAKPGDVALSGDDSKYFPRCSHPMDTHNADNRYDAFISYASRRDYLTARRIESFLEAFHKTPTPRGARCGDFKSAERNQPVSARSRWRGLVDHRSRTLRSAPHHCPVLARSGSLAVGGAGNFVDARTPRAGWHSAGGDGMS
jgi:hypothetical protein